jgi:hypothetical protein
MRPDPGQADATVVLAPSVAGSATGEGAVAIPRLGSFSARLPLPRARAFYGPLAARLALLTIVALSFAVVAFATAQPSVLVPRSPVSFPGWFAGPLHGLLGRLDDDPFALSVGLTVVLVAMGLAYLVALRTVRLLSMRMIVAAVLVIHLIMLMSPPLQLTDVFNYIGYARLGALHHLNPYRHVIAQAAHDPAFRFSTWHHLKSPYGPAFTAVSYPLAFLPIPVAYWAYKLAIVCASLALTGIVWRCARQLGRDPRFAVLFVALNPIVIVYAIGGFHNDFFMLVPAIGAVSLLLARRDRAAGAALMLAVSIKFTAILLLPFLLVAARPPRRRLRLLTGAAAAAVPLVALSVALFGLSMPNLSDQSTLLTDFSIPNLAGLALGLGGGAPALLRMANVALVLVVALLIRRRRDWMTSSGWATLGLIASLPWLVPWYVTWLLPFAALGASVRLRRAALILSTFLVLSFVPATGIVLSHLRIDPMAGSAAHASQVRQHTLEQ